MVCFFILVVVGMLFLIGGVGGVVVFFSVLVGYFVGWFLVLVIIVLIMNFKVNLFWLWEFFVVLIGGVFFINLVGLIGLVFIIYISFKVVLIGSVVYMLGDLLKVILCVMIS